LERQILADVQHKLSEMQANRDEPREGRHEWRTKPSVL
jgi:hypothetical protein